MLTEANDARLLNGFDYDGRPIITMRVGRQNTQPSERQILHLIFCLERAIDYMPEGQDSMLILVDYKSATLKSNPSISTALKVRESFNNQARTALLTFPRHRSSIFYRTITLKDSDERS